MPLLFTLLLLSSLLFSFAPLTHAQTTGLSISPPVVEILLAPNKNIIQSFELTNQGESGQFVANIHAVIPIDNEGHTTIDPTPLDLTTIPLIPTLANADKELGQPFTLPAGQSTQLVLKLESASTDTSSDTYLALVVSPASPPSQIFTQTNPALSALILITLSGDNLIPIDLTVDDFELPLLHDNLTPLEITATLHNSAPVMLRTEGSLEIISPRNSTTTTISLYPHLVLSGSNRLIQGKSDDNPPLPIDLRYHPTLGNLGPYRFKLEIITLGGSQITSLEKTVWLLPLRATLILLLLAIAISILLISLRKRRHSQNPDP